MGSFTVFPAIDLIEGRLVRLRRGRKEEETRYPSSPAAAAAAFQRAGAEWIHVVDLDGAFGAGTANWRALESILEVGLPVQFGGGLRDLAAIESALALGVARVILGTLAVEEPATLADALAHHGAGSIAVAVDARGEVLQTHGWTRGHGLPVLKFGERMAAVGVTTAIYTAADRDGTGAGLAVERAARLQQETGLKVIVAGGANSIDDIQDAKAAGLAGVVVGKALHDGRLSLPEVLAC